MLSSTAMMHVDPQAGFLQQAAQTPSPNYGPRPDGCAPTLIVIHGISLPAGEFGGGYIEQLFTNTLDTRTDPRFTYLDGLRVSAHLLIDRVGRTKQFVSFNDRAWHAGRSVFAGRPECNDYSIGIELEGTDDSPYAEQQYDRLEQVIGALWRAYPSLADKQVVGHCHIAPGRKTDPGPAFDWGRLMSNLGISMPTRQDAEGDP